MCVKSIIISVLAVQQGLLCAGEQALGSPSAQGFLDVPKTVTCPYPSGNQYSDTDVKMALQAAWDKRDDPIGPNQKYPHVYYGDGDFRGCQEPLLEFPLMRTIAYRGGDPGAVRVIYNALNNPDNDIRYCGTVIHKLKGNGFNFCNDKRNYNFEL